MIKIGDKIDDRYRIVSRIAHGGMADVYEANDLINHKVVSLKIMREDLLDDPRNIERFKKETAASASLNNPNIVKVYGRGVVEGRPYMANEYIKGQTLRDKLNFSVVLSLSDACEVMLQLTSGIAYIHEHGILHRDIKPENLFYMSDGTLKITDFGIATSMDETSNDDDSIQGTVYYCAPEIFTGETPGVASDIYSMGIVFFELLTGKVPFDGNTPTEVAMKHVKKHFPEPSKVLPTIPKAIEKIIIKATRKSPSDRYKDANEMHEALVKAMSDKENFKERRGLLSRIFGFK
ncbi:MAG: protein kinase [Bacilli bacterium]|nr:protein kinase [Bacilli bacterium]